jgi:hypothetical protein
MHDRVRWLVETCGRGSIGWNSGFSNINDEATYEANLHWLENVDFLSKQD